MRFQEKNNRGQRIVFKKLCKMVGCNYNYFNFERDNWYCSFIWPNKKEKQFIKWLNRKIRWNKNVRNGLAELPFLIKKDKIARKKFIDWFILMYGWKTKR